MTAAVFRGGFAAVAGSQFCVIRVKQNVIPAFLYWFLNLPETQEKLAAGARGTYVKSLPASALRELKIPVLPLPKQKVIAELHGLRLTEKRLVADLVSLRARLIDQSVLHFINR
jgi:restriction endonuclease S subunit